MRTVWRIVATKIKSKSCSIMMVSFALLDMLVAVPIAGYIMAKHSLTGVRNATETEEVKEKALFLKIMLILPLIFAILTVMVLIFSNVLQSLLTVMLRVLTFVTLSRLLEDKYAIPIWIYSVVGTCQLLLDCMASAVGERSNRSWKETVERVFPRIWIMGFVATFLSITFFLVTENIRKFAWIYYTEYVMGWEVLLAASYFWTIYETMFSIQEEDETAHRDNNRTEEISYCHVQLDPLPHEQEMFPRRF